MASLKGLGLDSKVVMKRFGKGKKRLQGNIVDLFPGTPTDPDK